MPAKVRVRHCLLAQRAALSEVQNREKSALIAVHACALPAFCASRTIMVYIALPQEVQTYPLIAAARRQGKHLAVPVVTGKSLQAVALPLEHGQLRRGPYGILEPCDTSAVVPPEQIDCVFVPGLAFDRHGGRLGFGGGYYDRFLCHISPLASVCGLAFGIQVVPCVPQMPHDIRMHVLVTEQGPIPCTPAPPGQAANDCRGRA